MKYLLIVFLVLLLLVTGCTGSAETPSPPSNAESSYSCNVRQGFNFEKDSQELVGFINYLRIGDEDLSSDISVTDPENPSGPQLKVFGVVSSIFWNGGYADPVQFSAQVTTGNKNAIAYLLHQTMSNTGIEYSFTIYDYDPKAKKYYPCFHSNAVILKGLVYKSGGEFSMSVNMEQSMEVVSPKNFTFMLGVMPQDSAQQIHIAFSVADKMTKPWGVAVN